MKWIAEWRALSKRIDRLREGAEFIVNCDKSIGQYESARAIEEYWIPTITETQRDLGNFLERHSALLPPDAAQLHNQLARVPTLNFSGNSIQKMQYGLSILLVFQAKLDHLIGDFELFARRTIERSFVHLRRTLVVDANVSNSWKKVFEGVGETGVERLGAVHLLSHGIWAFKINSEGEKTDLVLGEPFKTVQDDVSRTAEVVALTEWKIVKDKKDVQPLASKALTQAKLYASGSLAGLELERWRYLVLVSLDRILPLPEDVKDGSITYRHINIPIKPASPSRQKV